MLFFIPKHSFILQTIIINKGDLMKYLTASVAFSIMLFTLNGCENETGSPLKSNELGKQTGKTSELSLTQAPIIDSENSSMQTQPSLTLNKENNDSQKADAPFALTDFRSAIDMVVQDSIQEEVETAVENELAKNADKQK
jgi:hypothetical protein